VYADKEEHSSSIKMGLAMAIDLKQNGVVNSLAVRPEVRLGCQKDDK